MTGTPIVNSVPVIIYDSVICAILIAFSVYDIKTRRVPNKALAAFLPVVLLGPFLSGPNAYWSAVVQSFLGAVCGFAILLIAGLVSKNGTGIGGGDIKIAGLIGFAFGPYMVMGILLFSSIIAAPFGFIHMRRKKSERPLHIAFVPFLAAGSLIAMAVKLFH